MYVDPTQLGVVRVVIVTRLAPVIAVRLGVWGGVDWELEQLKPGCLGWQEEDCEEQGDHLAVTTRLLPALLISQCNVNSIPVICDVL